MLSCYLAAYGSPPRFLALGQHETGIDLGDAAALTAQLHQYWWQFPLRAELPRSAPARERAAWESFPVWSGGVPESVLIATDGSGAGAAPGLLLRGLRLQAVVPHRLGRRALGGHALASPKREEQCRDHGLLYRRVGGPSSGSHVG